ncbi:hypothetical protein QTG54_014961 [Skeletonema marinoi]|uniref:Uncharacterized protein n=1 Tax=Skeletonema marinoi TaxID=267567 RepID=A0AAD8XV57_9STRA|nr:hypothetical protein QTG54_014961 [Skeletonema marinoi]
MESLKKRWDEWVISLKKNKTEASGDKDAKTKYTQIVYVVGPSGTGKSFTGDYMQSMHGYQHVDGDIPLQNMTLVPEYTEMVEKAMLKDDWAPYCSELARLTLEAAKDNDKVVLSHATKKNYYRDHVIKKLIEGGASEDHITIIQLTIDPKVKARGLYHRTARMAEQSDMTMTGKEVYRVAFDLLYLFYHHFHSYSTCHFPDLRTQDLCKAFWEFEGEMTEEKYIDVFLKASGQSFSFDAFEVHPKAIMVGVSGRNVTHFDSVDKALGLTRSNELSESICANSDEARDKMESGYLQAIAELMAKKEDGQKSSLVDVDEDEKKEEKMDEKKVEEMKRRRSTIVQCELLMRDFSSSRIESTEKVGICRKSLIKTGKIAED